MVLFICSFVPRKRTKETADEWKKRVLMEQELHGERVSEKFVEMHGGVIQYFYEFS